MDERVRISLWMVGGGVFGAILGSAFGGLTGALHSRTGQWLGTPFGRMVADAFARTAEREPTRVRQGILIGAADGFLFLGILGTASGVLLGISQHTDKRLLGSVVLGSLLLVGGAIFFGGLAYALTNRGVWTLGSVIAGGLLGSFIAALILGADRLLLGVVPGLFVGLLFSFATRRYALAFRPPRVGKVAPRIRQDAETDITGPPHPCQDDDSFQKPDPFDDQ